jgi:anthranilate phosphoribosyltransferase
MADFDAILDGELSEDEVVQVLTEMAIRGETVEELVAAVEAMRTRMLSVQLSKPSIDVCGTGGVMGDRFNTSTATAFALAAIGIPVAKHGNRGSRMPNGSFDFLEALGIPIDLGPAGVQEVFSRTDLSFMFARQFHPAVGSIGSARKRIGGRTIFNLIGPLCNPAGVSRQLLGTVSVELSEKLAAAVMHLGTERTIIVVGPNGRDELASDGVSKILEVTSSQITTYTCDPREFAPDVNVVGGNAVENARQFEGWLDNPDSNPALSVSIALNCAAAMYLVGHSATFKDGFEAAFGLIRSRVVQHKVAQYIAVSREVYAQFGG